MLKHKLEVYDQLEKHLQQARAKALSEEEQHLAKMREDYPMCDNAALLRRPSLISAHLDGALLKEHGLLSPSECLPAVPTRNLPPRGTSYYMFDSGKWMRERGEGRRGKEKGGEEEEIERKKVVAGEY